MRADSARAHTRTRAVLVALAAAAAARAAAAPQPSAAASAPGCRVGDAPRAFGVTLVTQCNDERLWNVWNICERWKGPISVAVAAKHRLPAAEAHARRAIQPCASPSSFVARGGVERRRRETRSVLADSCGVAPPLVPTPSKRTRTRATLNAGAEARAGRALPRQRFTERRLGARDDVARSDSRRGLLAVGRDVRLRAVGRARRRRAS